MAEDENPDWFQKSDARIAQLKDLAWQMRDSSEVPLKEQLERLKELVTEDEPSRPTPADREKMLERLRQKHGDLPRKALLLKEFALRGEDLRTLSQEMRRASPRDLHAAIMMGEIAQARRLIEEGIDVDAPSGTGDSPLQTAVTFKQPEIVQALREAGATIGVWEAVALGQPATLQSLLDKGADANTRENGFTLLNRAVGQGNTEMVQILLARGADVNDAGEHGYTPLMSASRQNPEIVDLLLAAGAHVGLVEAILLQDRALILHWLDAGADIDGENAAGLTPLLAAATQGDLASIRLLLERGADLHKVNSKHNSALSRAILHDQSEAVNLLLDMGMDVNAPGFSESELLRGRTSIYFAILSQSPEMIRLLIERGATLDVSDGGGNTPLHWATMNCAPEVIEVLLDAGADIDAVDARQWTPLMQVVFHVLVKKDVHSACVRLLLDRGANVNARAERGKTALMLAAGHGYTELVTLLLDGGADIDATDEYGFTALTSPALGNRDEVRALLKGRGAKSRWEKPIPEL
jgi:ankyrin repeat protein